MARTRLADRDGRSVAGRRHRTPPVRTLHSRRRSLRFSTVGMADLIIVLDHGRIIGTGSHYQLLTRGGLYAEPFELQARPTADPCYRINRRVW